MLGKLLGILGVGMTGPSSGDQSLLREIASQRSQDSLAGARIGSRAITQHLYDKLNGPRGVHIESKLCALGALAGFACQAALRADNKAKGQPEMNDLVVANTQDGQRHFFGDALNMPLAGVQYSVWGWSPARRSNPAAPNCLRSAKSSGMRPKVSAPRLSANLAYRHSTNRRPCRSTT